MTPRLAAVRLFCAILVLLAASAAEAQFEKLANTTPEQRARALTDIMKVKLALTADEEPKIAALNLEYAQKMEPVIKGGEGYFASMRQARSINEEKEAAMKRVLTPAQFDQYTAAKEEIRQKFEERFAQ